MICNFLEIFADNHSAGYYAAFAWSILNSIADTKIQPPKLLFQREIQNAAGIPEAVRVYLLFFITYSNLFSLTMNIAIDEKVYGKQEIASRPLRSSTTCNDEH